MAPTAVRIPFVVFGAGVSSATVDSTMTVLLSIMTISADLYALLGNFEAQD